MEKIVLPKEEAQKFCDYYNGGDWAGLDYLRSESNITKLLDWDTYDLLYAVCSMNAILNDYLWVSSLDSHNVEARPAFSEDWLYDFEDKYIESKKKLISRFSNISYNEKTGELEIMVGAENE